MRIPLDDIVRITSGTLLGSPDRFVEELFTDSRSQPRNTSGAMFVALRGTRHDGHRFIPELATSGIRMFLVSQVPEAYTLPADACMIVVADSLQALQQIAAYHRGLFSFPVVGITGSNGKTIVKEWVYQLLHGRYSLVKSPRSYNSQVGVPLSVLLIQSEHELALIEAGISEYGEMERLERIIQPVIGILTNIGEAHQENFPDIRSKLKEKLQLFKNSASLLYCKDQKVVEEEIQNVYGRQGPRLISWSMKTAAELEIKKIESQDGKTNITAFWQGRAMGFVIPFADDASVENAIHCLLVCLHLGYDEMLLQEQFPLLSPVAMRMELKNGINGCTLINDSYSSDLVSLSIALDFLKQQRQNPLKTLILSDILQSGKSDDLLYNEVATLVRAKGVDRVIGIGTSILKFRSLFPPDSSFYKSTPDLLAALPGLRFRDEAILLKGARVFGFERISELLEQKRHQTRLEINLQAMVHNLNYFRSLLKPGTRIMGMVKALSYGAGTYEIASMLQFQKVDYLAVAVTDEGKALRDAGIMLPMVVMSPEPASFDAMVRAALEPELYSLPLMRLFMHYAAQNGLQQYPVHLKIDTGMHRLGFTVDDIPALLDLLRHNQQLRICSVFSHLAGSEDPDMDSFTRQQIVDFNIISDQLGAVTGNSFYRHILNSAGIERFPEAQMDMVRLGIGLYGVSSVNQAALRQVGTLRSIITQLKLLRPGDTVGYNRKGLIVERSAIAVVPIGYADGLNRKLGNGKGYFLVKGNRAPIVGNVCMDMCMINVTGLDVREGDEVIVFGEGLPVRQLADWLGTIPYEVLTGISSRVKRVYFQE